MTAPLAFLLCLPPAADDDDFRHWATLKSLSEMAGEEDEIVIAHAGPSPVLARFADAGGWPRPPEQIHLDARTSSEVLAETAAAAATHPGLFLPPGGVLQAEGLAELRQSLSKHPGRLHLLARGFRLAGLDTPLPPPESHRWPPEVPANLRPDPARLVPYAAPGSSDLVEAAAFYLKRLEEAGSPAMVGTAPVLEPVPRSLAPALLAAAIKEAWVRPAWLSDELTLLGPEEVGEVLDRLETICAGSGSIAEVFRSETGPLSRIMNALTSGDASRALSEILLCIASQDRAERRAVAAALGRLRSDLDLALPGERYLRETYERLRRARE
ncbi:hypothetical protein [Histidinibacterium aquaticum]|uniref:Uncharacterized protein n=1 Tax=Histidinibacterium aquaticum TaxID=2613962 RepID=A0A5J5GB97_9RHOB|nr:hypothetical protein [Histidinibacterium aquaticum]KAA9005092.1 hypothetical protein F3S47_18870 [Histidinibacterium aquaticum]